MYYMGGPDPPWEWAVLRGERGVPLGTLCGHLRKNGVSFALWARNRMCRRNHVSYEGPAVLRDVAMTTKFVTPFAITGL